MGTSRRAIISAGLAAVLLCGTSSAAYAGQRTEERISKVVSARLLPDGQVALRVLRSCTYIFESFYHGPETLIVLAQGESSATFLLRSDTCVGHPRLERVSGGAPGSLHKGLTDVRIYEQKCWTERFDDELGSDRYEKVCYPVAESRSQLLLR